MSAKPPSPEEVRELPAGLRLIVPASFQDENGHMNIRYYLDLGGQVIDQVFQGFGITDDYREQRSLSFFTVEHHLRYFAECHTQDQVDVRMRLLERSDKLVHGMTFLVNESRDTLANTLEFTAIHVDLATRRPAPFPADVSDAIDAVFDRQGAPTWPAPVCGSMGVRAAPHR